MLEDINATKIMIQQQVDAGKVFMSGVPFCKYQKVYGFTNENIDGYMSQLNFKNKDSAITVLASGDHLLNLIYNGVTTIDTFDSNKLTEYYTLGIKMAAILAFSYDEYLEFYKRILNPFISLDELMNYLFSLFPFMEKKYRIYWEEILLFNYHIQKNNENVLNLFHMLLINIRNLENSVLKNTYLLNQENYDKVRKQLNSVHIQFQCCDCFMLHQYFSSSYDFVMLSNIPDYFYKTFGNFWDYSKFVETTAYFKDFLKVDGILAFAYLIQCYSAYSDSFKTHLILNSNISKNDFVTEEILLFPHILNSHRSFWVRDGLLLERKLF